MNKKITQKMLNEVLEEVIKPLIIKIKPFVKDNQTALKVLKKLKPLHVSFLPIRDDIDIKEIYNSLEELKNLNLLKEYELEKIKSSLCDLLQEYMQKRNLKFNCIYEANNEEEFIDFDSEFEDDNIHKEEFIDFDTEFNDDNIEKMHYEEHQKISAEEFMSYNEIDEHIINEIEELINEFHFLSERDIDESFISIFVRIINHFISIFNLSIEFRNIAYSLENLYNLLINLDLSKVSKDFLKTFLISIIEDLAKFNSEVFINKSAIDIHYMDASLLANVAQLEIMLNQKEDNEIEFF